MPRSLKTILAAICGGLVMLCIVKIVTSADSMAGRRLLSDCDGAIKSLAIQYVREAAPVCGDAYRDFLSQLPKDTTVYVCCRDKDDFSDLRKRVGAIQCRLVPVTNGRAITCWSRDRWLSLAPSTTRGKTMLLTPVEEKATIAWERRRADMKVAGDLASSVSGLMSRKSDLAFDGGDFAGDSRCVFVTPDVAHRNVGTRVSTKGELLLRLGAILGRKVILLDKAPPYHAGMFMMPIGENRILVGDPSLGRQLLKSNNTPLPENAKHADFSTTTQALFDDVAETCRNNGYDVTRMPVVPCSDQRTYLTYVNVIIDQRAGSRTVYMPVFDGVEPLNQAATDVWTSQGYRVIRVNCTNSYPSFGSLRCLVNILER